MKKIEDLSDKELLDLFTENCQTKDGNQYRIELERRLEDRAVLEEQAWTDSER